jgi:hypothetical protein
MPIGLNSTSPGLFVIFAPGSALDQSRAYQPSVCKLPLVIRAFERKQVGVILLDLSKNTDDSALV